MLSTHGPEQVLSPCRLSAGDRTSCDVGERSLSVCFRGRTRCSKGRPSIPL